MKRRYQEIWDQLLKRKVLDVEAPVDAHARIVKAVHKEKDMAVANRKKFRMEAKSEGNLIHFRLRAKVNLYNL